MLKAVRFDEEEHKDILKYIADFKDLKGRKNESEAIRTLMQLGYDSLQQQEKSVETPTIDIEAIKSDIFNQIMAALPINSLQTTRQDTEEQGFIPVKGGFGSGDRYYDELKKETNTIQEKEVEKPKIDMSNPLIANLLGNINK